MRVQLVAVGRLKVGPERDLAERYRSRAEAMGRGLGFSGPEMVELAEGRGRRAQERQADEGARIREKVGCSILAVLDETAPAPTSAEFAAKLATWRDEGRAALALAIGGPDGHDPGLRGEAAWAISFGRLTLPHQLVRVLAMEQIYRAFTIIGGHPYHRPGGGQG